MDNSLLVAANMAILKPWPSENLAALTLALTGFGVVDEVNMAYKPALEAGLIQKNGWPVAKGETVAALAAVITERMSDGRLT